MLQAILAIMLPLTVWIRFSLYPVFYFPGVAIFTQEITVGVFLFAESEISA